MQKRRRFLDKLQPARTMMCVAILLIIAFQSYWVNRLYKEEKLGLQKETNAIFRDVVYNLRVERLKKDTHFFRSPVKPDLFTYDAVTAIKKRAADPRKDSNRVKVTIDSGRSSMVFVRDFSTDTGTALRQPGIVFRRGEPPPELREMILRQGGGGAVNRLIVSDSAALKQLVQGFGGVNIRIGPRRNDTMDRPAVKDKIIIHEPADVKVLRDKKLPPIPGSSMRGQVSIKMDATPESAIFRMFTEGKVLDDTLSMTKLDSAYKKELAKANIALNFSLKTGKYDSLHWKDTIASTQFATRPEKVGFYKPNWYQAELENPTMFLVKKISPQILFSIFLAAFTTAAFIFLYRNLAAQRRLTEMKNDFISNITHELKTPIATVSVAVEALRNFGGIQSPERTKEYLDISASELQRLGLLVDKVLKLSLFENRELDLKKETFDLKALTEEVLNTMKLQFEKHHAKVNLSVQGNYFAVDADRLHITSVIYNLLDNALKYSTGKPEIDVFLKHETDRVILEVSDKGIGIEDGFKTKIFDKFFRVPTGDHHNIKGYGLGLSYVSHVVKKHDGTIQVNSEPGKGSTFIVKLPIA